MELRQLRYFVVLAEELNYRAAAERLRIAKPTLSQQIAVLERSLGRQLLERRRSPVSLTPAGVVLLEKSRELLSLADRLRTAVHAASAEPEATQVRIVHGVERVLAAELEVLQEQSATPVALALTSGLDAEEAVASGRAQAALIWMSTGFHNSLHAEQVAVTAVSLAVPDGHRFASLPAVPVQELAGETIALFPQAVAPRLWEHYVDHLLPEGVAPRKILQDWSGLLPMLSMLTAVSEGRAVAPFVHQVAEAVALPGVTLRPLDPPLVLPVLLVSRDPCRPELRALRSVLQRAGTGT